MSATRRCIDCQAPVPPGRGRRSLLTRQHYRLEAPGSRRRVLCIGSDRPYAEQPIIVKGEDAPPREEPGMISISSTDEYHLGQCSLKLRVAALILAHRGGFTPQDITDLLRETSRAAEQLVGEVRRTEEYQLIWQRWHAADKAARAWAASLLPKNVVRVDFVERRRVG